MQSQYVQIQQHQNVQQRKVNETLQIQNNRQRHQINRLQKNQMLVPRANLKNCVRPKQVEKYRIAQNFSSMKIYLVKKTKINCVLMILNNI